MNILFLPGLFFLSFFPLWIVVACIDGLNIITSDVNLWTERISLVLIALGTLVSLLAVNRQMNQRMNCIRLTIERASKKKTVTAEYLLFYILPLLAFDFTKWKQVALFLTIFIILTFLCLKHRYVYANIILELCGYTCYDCTMKYSDGRPFETVVISPNELTGMLNHQIDYVRLGEGYGLEPKSSNAWPQQLP